MFKDPKVIDTITNIVSFALFMLEPVRSYFMTQPFNGWTFASCVLGAVVAYMTGKGISGRTAPIPKD